MRDHLAQLVRRKSQTLKVPSTNSKGCKKYFSAAARAREGDRVHPEAVGADAGRPQPAPPDGEGRRPGHLLRRVHASCGE